MVYWKLFVAFFRIGIFGFGGGPSMIPLFHAECVKKYNWVTPEEFFDYLALGNALPGPIATKMASYIGYRVKGWMGSVIAVSAVSIPVMAGMIVLLQVVAAFKDSEVVGRMIQAIQPVIGIMMAVMAYEFLGKGWKGQTSKGGFVAITVLSAAAFLLFSLHPGILVAIALAGSFLYSTWQTRKLRKGAKK